MLLITKEQAAVLQQQHAAYADCELKDLTVPVKLFTPMSNWTWYLLTQDPDQPDYLWAIVDGFEVEMGSVSLSELGGMYRGGMAMVERDMYYRPENAAELWQRLIN